VSAGVYLIAGWLVVADLPAYVRGMSGVELTFLVLGGAFYTVGGVVYALHRPNPFPKTFGYHEVFHALVVAGALCHYVTVTGLANAART
jgi:hemolysin III